MRLRNNPNAINILQENSEFVVMEPNKYKGKWKKLFNNDNPIYIEIGMGKGDFIYQHALKNPTINYIGIEKYPSVLAVAVNKIVKQGILPNLRLLDFDATELQDIFVEDEIDVLYLNFSDPWPKSRHAKRRLTSDIFLPIYQNILNKDGHIEFKTDNQGLFEYSLVSLNAYRMHFTYISLDLHNSEENEENIMTEYERKFCQKGPIYKLVANF